MLAPEQIAAHRRHGSILVEDALSAPQLSGRMICGEQPRIARLEPVPAVILLPPAQDSSADPRGAAQRQGRLGLLDLRELSARAAGSLVGSSAPECARGTLEQFGPEPREDFMKTREEKMGIAHALLDRLNTQRIPFLLDVEKRVKAGERLSDYELDRLQEALKDAQSNESVIAELIDEFPELQGLASRVVDLYGSITSKALENEEKAEGS